MRLSHCVSTAVMEDDLYRYDTAHPVAKSGLFATRGRRNDATSLMAVINDKAKLPCCRLSKSETKVGSANNPTVVFRFALMKGRLMACVETSFEFKRITISTSSTRETRTGQNRGRSTRTRFGNCSLTATPS